MAKRKKPSRHGRSGDPSKRAAEDARIEAEAGPELEDAVADALETEHPIGLLMLASALLASVDPDLPTVDESAALPSADEVVRMFLDADDPDLAVFGWAVTRLLPEARLRVEADLAVDADLLPDWLAPLSEARVVAAWQTTDPLRDSTDIALGVRVGEADLSLISLVDFNTEGAIKDAFAVPVPLREVQAALDKTGEVGMVARDLTPADARAWLTQAIAAGDLVDPPFESDTWPQLRPLLQWALRLCPTGGQGWERQSWSTEEIAAVVAEFAASPGGGVVAAPEDRAVLVDALRILGQESYGDPLLLSAVKLEMGLGYLWSTTLHHDLDRLLALPDTLGPYVRWAHARRGIPADDTDEALAALAHRRAEFSRDVTAILGDPDAD